MDTCPDYALIVPSAVLNNVVFPAPFSATTPIIAISERKSNDKLSKARFSTFFLFYLVLNITVKSVA